MRRLLVPLILLVSANASALNCDSSRPYVFRGIQVVYFTSVQDAISRALAGEEVYIPKGHWPENLLFSEKHNLSFTTLCEASIRSVYLRRSSGITLKGLTIDGAGSNLDGVLLGAGANGNQNITLKQLEIKNVGATSAGIRIDPNNINTLIEDNYIHHNLKEGIFFTGTGAGGPHLFRNNQIYKNGLNGFLLSKNQNIQLEGNLISSNGQSGPGYGVNINGTGPIEPLRLTLSNNYFTNNHGTVTATKTKDMNYFSQIIDATDTGNISTTGLEGGSTAVLVDVQSPLVQLLFPAPLHRVNSLNFSFRARVTDAMAVQSQLYHNGQLVLNSDSLYLKAAITLIEGSNTFSLVSTDSLNNSSTMNFSIEADLTAPQMIRNRPAIGQSLRVGRLPYQAIVNFSSNEALSKAILNGVDVGVLAGGYSIEALVNLQAAGSNTIELIVEDLVGNQTIYTTNINVILGAPGPELTSVYPANNSRVTLRDFSFGFALNKPTYGLKINGVPATIAIGATYITVPYHVADQGLTLIEFAFSDAVGNVSTYYLSYLFDTDDDDPVIITNLRSSQSTTSPYFYPNVTIEDENPGIVNVILNGARLFSTQSASFSFPLYMATDGNYVLQFEAIDQLGNLKLSPEYLVIRDTTPPLLSLSSPLAGITYNQRTLLISGTVNENMNNIVINGEFISSRISEGAFSFYYMSSIEGAQNLLITAEDDLGNRGHTNIAIEIESSSQDRWTYSECSLNEAPL